MNQPRDLSDLLVCILCMLFIMIMIPLVICALIGFALADCAERYFQKPEDRRAQRN